MRRWLWVVGVVALALGLVALVAWRMRRWLIAMSAVAAAVGLVLAVLVVLMVWRMRRWLMGVGVVAVGIGVVALVAWDLVVALNLPDGRDKFRAELLGLLIPLAAVIAGAGALLNFVNSRTANREQLELSRRGQLTERFGRAIDQLGKGDMGEGRDIRIGGIYALEQIARESAELHPPVMEVLTAFVREHRPWSGEPALDRSGKLPADIQAALTVVGRRNPEQDYGSIDLSSTDLGQADLFRANLQGAFLFRANLQGASLWQANLQAAFLRDADLQEAYLRDANLQEADLMGANLQRADFWGTDLWGADLSGANLQGVNLQGAVVSRGQIAAASTDAATVPP
jgi:hypothetical protein